METELEKLSRDGYLVVPAVLSHNEVIYYRDIFNRILDSKIDPSKGDSAIARNDVLCRYPEIRKLFFKDVIIASLKKVLGTNFVVMPEASIMESHYGGWHKDTTSIELFGFKFHKNEDFKIINVAIYLQDNNEDGGGLDVIPGSHKDPDIYTNIYRKKHSSLNIGSGVRRLLSTGLRKLVINFAPYLLKSKKEIIDSNLRSIKTRDQDLENRGASIPSKAGDMVIFDLRLNHKATWPKSQLTPDNHTKKYGFFVFVGSKNKSTEEYHKYLLARAEKQYAYGYLLNRKVDEKITREAEKFQFEIL